MGCCHPRNLADFDNWFSYGFCYSGNILSVISHLFFVHNKNLAFTPVIYLYEEIPSPQSGYLCKPIGNCLRCVATGNFEGNSPDTKYRWLAWPGLGLFIAVFLCFF